MYRLSLPPPVARMQARLDDDVCKRHVFYRAPIANKKADASIRIVDGEIAEIVIAHGVLIQAADANGARTGNHGAVGDIDVFRIMLEIFVAGQVEMVVVSRDGDAIVAAADVAIGNQNIAA